MGSPHHVPITLYAACVAGMPSAVPWQTAVLIAAGSVRQAERYQCEFHPREEAGKIPEREPVVPDPADQRTGSDGATLHALLLAEVFLHKGTEAPPVELTQCGQPNASSSYIRAAIHDAFPNTRFPGNYSVRCR